MTRDTKSLEPFADIDLGTISDKLIIFLCRELGLNSIEFLEPLTRLKGGYETCICRFQLSGLDKNLEKPMILRIYADHADVYQAARETIIQNAMAEQGYPVPPVHGNCLDKAVLGNTFLIMDYVDGDTLMESNIDSGQIFEILGNIHARLHNISPEPIATKFVESEWTYQSLTYDGKLEWLKTMVIQNFPWLIEAVEWLLDNRPDDPQNLSVCHGDFHPMNILAKNSQVQAVLDWSGFLIADSVLDVSTTSFLIDFPMGKIYPDLDSKPTKKRYLDAYQKIKPLDETKMAYYGIFRRVQALTEAARGQAVFQHSDTIELLTTSITETTGLEIKGP